MYNGIGVQTPRGSGTNGYAQKNLANVVKSKDRDDLKKPNKLSVPSLRKPNNDIIEHYRKRKLEVKRLEFQLMLEDQKAKETHETVAAQIHKNNQFRKAFGISENFVDGSSSEPEWQGKEAASKATIKQAKYMLISSPPSSDEEERKIATSGIIEKRSSHKSKKRNRKSSLPKTTNSKKKKKKKKKKKHKRKSGSDSQRKHEDTASSGSELRKRSRHKGRESLGKRRNHREHSREFSSRLDHRKDELDHRHDLPNGDLCKHGTGDKEKTVSSFHHHRGRSPPLGETDRHKHRRSDQRVQSTAIEEDVNDSRKRDSDKQTSTHRGQTEAEEFKERERRKHRDVDRDTTKRRRSESLDEYVKRARNSVFSKSRDETVKHARKRYEITPTPSPKRYYPEDKDQTKTKSPRHEMMQDRSRSYDSSPSESKKHKNDWPAEKVEEKKRARLAEIPEQYRQRQVDDRVDEKGNELRSRLLSATPERYRRSKVEDRTKQTKISEPKIRIRLETPEQSSDEQTCYSEENSSRRQTSAERSLGRFQQKRRGDSGSPRRSNLLSYSPMEMYPKRYMNLFKDMPKKYRHESENECAQEAIQPQIVRDAKSESQSNIEHEALGKSESEVTNLKNTVNKGSSEVAEKARKDTDMRMDDEATSSSTVLDSVTLQPIAHSSFFQSQTEDEKTGEGIQTTLTAADMVDEAVKKTATALAANREKTLESLKKLLSNELQSDKENDSNSKLSRKARLSASCSRSSSLSDSSHSFRSRNSLTSSSDSSSENSDCSRGSSRYRQHKHRSRKLTRKSHRSRRLSISETSDSSRSGSSRFRSSSKENDDKKKKSNRKKKSSSKNASEDSMKKKNQNRDAKKTASSSSYESHSSSSESSSSRSRSRSISIPRRKGSPSFLERRRITSNKIKKRSSSSASTSTGSSTDSSPSSLE